jgi:hypothetical protein
MTVQEACSKLITYFETQYKNVLNGSPSYLTDIFPESLTEEFTADILKELQGYMGSTNSTTEGQFTGIQEAFAFMLSIQRQENLRKGSRLKRRLNIVNYKRNIGIVEGPLGTQLSNIGIVTGTEFINNLETV